MPGKRVDDDTFEAISAVARQSGKSFQELADEAFAALLEAAAAGRAKGIAQREREQAREVMPRYNNLSDAGGDVR